MTRNCCLCGAATTEYLWVRVERGPPGKRPPIAPAYAGLVPVCLSHIQDVANRFINPAIALQNAGWEFRKAHKETP